MMAGQWSPSWGMSTLGWIDLARKRIVEGAGKDAGGRRLADAAHAGEDIGLMDAVGGEGIGERPHHRLLADEVVEPRGRYLRASARWGTHARRRPGAGAQDPTGKRGSSAAAFRASSISARSIGRIAASLAAARTPAPRRQSGAKVRGWTKTRPGSLGLLPSGPDPVGERFVLRQPPAPYLDHGARRRKGRAAAAIGYRLPPF